MLPVPYPEKVDLTVACRCLVEASCNVMLVSMSVGSVCRRAHMSTSVHLGPLKSMLMGV